MDKGKAYCNSQTDNGSEMISMRGNHSWGLIMGLLHSEFYLQLLSKLILKKISFVLHKVQREIQHFKLCHGLRSNVPSEDIFKQTVLHSGKFLSDPNECRGTDWIIPDCCKKRKIKKDQLVDR